MNVRALLSGGAALLLALACSTAGGIDFRPVRWFRFQAARWIGFGMVGCPWSVLHVA